ncbi:HDIG domain-containing protein [Proteiniclasticum sp. BAD-10]|uniref:HDIG domain-containing protein n=2 Tax=Proteiniclasticum sediminis TaxID=2804028 RepID=A0A941CND8_9CLOT|nr:HDIG domain-containing metalloprotein [Proteiniclasticum sediminis]MBR0575252.1 HDIG domain-containing protein [Proteiniclasticum sediminis]
MEVPKMKREEALALLLEYNSNDSLIRHAYAVEAVMRHFARSFGEDEEYWGNIGLLHDLDYEKYPDQHCSMTKVILEERRFDEKMIRAILSHGYGLCTDIKPELPLEKVLYTIDELTGLIMATVYMRPDKSIRELEMKSVLKKFKTPKFAAGVNREVILSGCTMLDRSVEEIIQECINGMRERADILGIT